MIVKGRARKDGFQLAAYVLDNAKKENEKVQVLDVKAGQTRDARAAIIDMDLATELTRRGEKGIYHVQINPAIGDDRKMSLDDWILAAENIENEIGFSGQNRVLVMHEKRGKDGILRQHVHAIWQREKDGKLLSLSHNYKAHDRAREKTEKQLQQQRTRQPNEIKKELSYLWHNSKDGQDFINKTFAKGYLIGKGYTTEKGRTRPYCVITPDGEKLDLIRQLEKVNTAEVQARLSTIEKSLPDEKHFAGRRRATERQDRKKQREKASAQENKNQTVEHTTLHIQETAQTAGQNFADIVQEPFKDTSIETMQTATQNFADISHDENATKKEAAQQFFEHKKQFTVRKDNTELLKHQPEKSLSKQKTAFEKRLDKAAENLKRDDFGLEHE